MNLSLAQPLLNKALVAGFLCTSSIAFAEEAPASEEKRRLLESSLGSSAIDAAGGLIIVIGFMLALAWLFKRFVQMPGMNKGQIQVLGGVSLGTRERAVLISVEGKRLLVGVAPGHVQTLYVLDDEEQPDTEEPFEEVMQQLQEKPE